MPPRLAEAGVVRSIAVEDPWPTNLYWRMLLADGRVVQCPVTIEQLHNMPSNRLVTLCAVAVGRFCRKHGPVPRPRHPAAAPDLVATVVGYRAWSVDAGGQLGPIGSGKGGWDGANEVLAQCATRHHAAPDPDCHCGYNAWHDPARLSPNEVHNVIGAIAARGRLEVHWDGFRAERARPLCLAYPDGETPQYRLAEVVAGATGIDREYLHPREPTMRDRVEAIARRLGLPAVPFSRLEAFAREHGSPVPEGLREPRPAGSHGGPNLTITMTATNAAAASFNAAATTAAQMSYHLRRSLRP